MPLTVGVEVPPRDRDVLEGWLRSPSLKAGLTSKQNCVAKDTGHSAHRPPEDRLTPEGTRFAPLLTKGTPITSARWTARAHSSPLLASSPRSGTPGCSPIAHLRICEHDFERTDASADDYGQIGDHTRLHLRHQRAGRCADDYGIRQVSPKEASS